MPTQTHYTYTDPRFLDGDSFEVAGKAVAQAEAAAKLLARALDDATVLARNAEMDRSIRDTGDPSAASWPDSPQGKRFAELSRQAKDAERQLRILKQAASFNPAAAA